jgi:hypothetical protein
MALPESLTALPHHTKLRIENICSSAAAKAVPGKRKKEKE